ncbi:MAG: class I SAM-dependent methyltransferase [Brevinematales bacterium]
MSKFYEIFVDYYDRIFPLSEELKNFVSSYVEIDNTYLDIGCGTGELAIYLSNKNILKEIIATDIDEAMLDKAKRKTKNVNFIKLDMRELNYHEKFDIISCFGNTIVHLTSLKDIENFFDNVFKALKKGGKFLFQILNYNILQNFPVIQNDVFIFERYYKYEKELIEFEVKFSLKKSKETFESSIFLYPLTFNKISEILTSLKIKNISFFSDFQKNPFNPEKSSLLVGVIEK